MKTEEVELTSCLVHKLVVTERFSRSRRSISALRLSPPRLARTTLLHIERLALLELYRRAGRTVVEISNQFLVHPVPLYMQRLSEDTRSFS